MLVVWMLTPDDGSRDGGMRSYLDNPDKWKRYDPELSTGLSGLLGTVSSPAVSLIERSTLLPRTSYYSAVVPDAGRERDLCCQGLLSAAGDADLVFVDPDNGIEVPSKPVGSKGSSKYVTWQEIRSLWETDCSILIYQHFPREPRVEFAKRLEAKLRERCGIPCTLAVRTPHTLYLLASQKRDEMQFREAVSLLSQQWTGQMEPLEVSRTPLQPTSFAGSRPTSAAICVEGSVPFAGGGRSSAQAVIV